MFPHRAPIGRQRSPAVACGGEAVEEPPRVAAPGPESGASALGQLGLHAEFALPALSKVLGHPVDPSGFSARAADAILRIAIALRDSHRTSAIPVLKTCQAAMENSDAWVTKNADVARARFEEIETVQRCSSSPLGRVILV